MLSDIENRALNLAQRQLDAYNTKDAKAFNACFSHDVEVRLFDGTLLKDLSGPAYAPFYAAFFTKEPDVRCHLIGRQIQNNIVIDQEYVTGFMSGDTKAAIAIYEINGSQITRVTFIS